MFLEVSGILVIGRLFSRDSHLAFSLIFAGAVAVLFAYEPHSFPGNPGPLLIPVDLSLALIPFTGLALNRTGWLITPIIGIAATYTSFLYSTTIYPTTPCEWTVTTQGYPYPIRHYIPPSESCLLYLLSGGNQIPIHGLNPSPITIYLYFITDIVFYTLLALSILELVAAARGFLSTNRKRVTLDHPRIPG